MASSGYTGLVDKKVPLFDVKEFGKWLEQIKAECYLRPYAGKILSDALDDPATQFKQLYPVEYSRIPEDCRPVNKEAITNDPEKVLGKFLNGLLGVQPVQVRDVVEAVDAADGQPAQSAIPVVEAQPGIDVALKIQM